MAIASAQSSGPPESSFSSPPVTIVLTIIFLACLFAGFFFVFFCRCFLENLIVTWNLRHSPAGTPAPVTGVNEGLDPSIIKKFPIFPYSSVKDFQKEKIGLECAICLSEFQDESFLRLLTTCCHVFHQECIDLWFESHKTCPVCRRSLETAIESPEKSPAAINEDGSLEDFVSITVKEENEDEREELGEKQRRGIDEREKFSRSQSTGHSIVRSRENDDHYEDRDRYTLRLPEHVKKKILRGHNWKSCTTFGEYKSKSSNGNGGFAEVDGFSGKEINRV